MKGNGSRASDGLTRLRNRLDEHIKETFLLSPFLVEVHQDFEIYKIGNRYLAVHYEDRDLLLERISTLNLGDFWTNIFQNKSKDALIEKVDSIRREAHGHFEGKNNLIYSKNLEKLIPGTSDLRKTRKENKNLKDDLQNWKRAWTTYFVPDHGE
ncbi:MAG: hypothetical protein IPK68_19625 [Bdellovibrionales bacterium]|nr:hypothetical protein [Bdellovibrionales bacterium]